MKIKKKYAFIILFLLLSLISEAQKPVSFYPFKGFHVGLTGQAEFIDKPTFMVVIDDDPVPKGRWTYGWEAGMEFSYHFAKYFGVSAGINYGTALSYSCDIYMRMISGFNDKWGIVNDYDTGISTMNEHEILFPVKLEFHYPLGKNLFFTTEVGIKIQGIYNRLAYGKHGEGFYKGTLTVLVPNASNNPNEPMDQIKYFTYWGKRDMSKISCNLLFGVGLYYQLPYGDLVRFIVGFNNSFHNIIEGDYLYYLSGSFGKFAVKNDFIYTQFAYIHTLNWQKAKKYVKKQEYTFASKKERREKMYELLRTW